MYLNQDGLSFSEVSGVSGLDHPGDSRAFATLDFDRDGWQDIAMVSANAPLFQLFRNQIGDRDDTRADIVAIRFVGGNKQAQASTEWSARDAYGAQVRVDLGDRTLLREHRAGEGLAAQNSPTMLVGIGDVDRGVGIEIRWPSGKTSTAADVTPGSLVTVYENAADSPTGAAFVLTPYRPAQPVRRRTPRPSAPMSTSQVSVGRPSGAKLTLYTTMATWCVPCLEELPNLNLLRDTFHSDELEIFGVPYDEEEAPETFAAWAEQNDPPYEILHTLTSAQINSVKDAALNELRLDGVPAAIVTDINGQVLLARWGPPSVSEVKSLLEQVR